MLTLLRNYFVKHPLWFNMLRKIIELNFQKQKRIIHEVFPKSPDARVLDIGCGTGEFSGFFPSEKYNGIDISPVYIEHAKKRRKGNFSVMDARNLEFAENSFDFILIMATLHHLSDTDAKKVIAEARRVLRPQGKILMLEDAKIQEFESFVVGFIQKFDFGEYIRTPEDYKKIFLPHFTLEREWQFRNGGCVYYAALMHK